MIRKNFFLTNDQYKFLSRLEGTLSEHLRRAIDDYIKKNRLEKFSKSPSSIENVHNKEI